jgi:hypothetical protein
MTPFIQSLISNQEKRIDRIPIRDAVKPVNQIIPQPRDNLIILIPRTGNFESRNYSNGGIGGKTKAGAAAGRRAAGADSLHCRAAPSRYAAAGGMPRRRKSNNFQPYLACVEHRWPSWYGDGIYIVDPVFLGSNPISGILFWPSDAGDAGSDP